MASGIMALLAKPKGKGGMEKSGPPKSEGEGDDDGGEVGSALLEMMDALKSGDGAGAALAFKRAKMACEDEDGGGDDMSDLGMGDEDETEEE